MSSTTALEHAPVASIHAGMGARAFDGGVSFRVWAPFASGIFVAGSFNDWSETTHPMALESAGYWSVDIPLAQLADQYKYVLVNGDQKIWRIDPYARDVTSSVGNGVVVDDCYEWQADEYRTPAWNELVLYEMHVGTFHDQPGGGPGNLHAALQKLPHLHDLGINAIQIMPPFEFAGGFSWGYNPAHLFAVEEDYGGPRALKKLIDQAHQLGIAVIFDVVYNHFGPSDLDLWQFDGWNKEGGGGIYFYNDWRGDTPWGPRPDYGRAEVRQFIRDNALNWLEEFRLDGLRWDATAYIRNAHGRDNDPGGDIPEGWQLMQWINHEVNVRQPWKMNIAEDMRGNDWITKSTSNGGAGFDAQWSSDFVHTVRAELITPDDGHRDLERIRSALYQRFNGDAFQRVIYTESHDEVANGKARLPQEIFPSDADSYFSRKRSTLGAALVLTTPGIPMLFQGQELLEDEWFRDDDPLNWERKETYAGVFQMYRDMVRLRRNWFDNTRGLRGQHINVFHLHQTPDNKGANKVMGLHRWLRGGARDDVVVLLNLANRAYENYTVGLPRGGRWKVRFNSDWKGYSEDFGNTPAFAADARAGNRDGMSHYGTFGLGPYSVLVLSQDS